MQGQVHHHRVVLGDDVVYFHAAGAQVVVQHEGGLFQPLASLRARGVLDEVLGNQLEGCGLAGLDASQETQYDVSCRGRGRLLHAGGSGAVRHATTVRRACSAERQGASRLAAFSVGGRRYLPVVLSSVNSRRRAVAVVVGTTLATALGAVTGALVGLDAHHPGRQVVWLVLSAVAVALATALPAGELYRSIRERRRAEDLAEAAESRLSVTLDDALEPIATRLARLAALAAAGPGADDDALQARAALATEIKLAVLTTAAHLVGGGRVRASLYRLSSDGSLQPDSYTGRGHPPTTVFRTATASGRFALDLVAAGGSYFCHDVDLDAPAGWTPTASEYRTFLSVAVGAGLRRYGMLSLDAPEVGDLVEQDADLTRVLAALLAAALPWAPGVTEPVPLPRLQQPLPLARTPEPPTMTRRVTS